MNKDAAAERDITDLARTQTSAPALEFDAAEWFSRRELPGDLTAHTTDAELAEIVAGQEHDCATHDRPARHILVGADEYLTKRREELREQDRERLAEVVTQLSKLTNTRNRMAAEQNGWGDSAREIAERVGLAQSTVRDSIKRGRAAAMWTIGLTARQASTLVTVLNGTQTDDAVWDQQPIQCLVDKLEDSASDSHAEQFEVGLADLLMTVRAWTRLQALAVLEAVRLYWAQSGTHGHDETLAAVGLVHPRYAKRTD
nr:hypothetical protein [Kibdelosporangium sp. MJ126-NF4]CEL13162.1 hypothetical protein [Kibdelosporangium sp. MJ126-NF4]CTQ98850.1 hypothetical protein [Kibdelosporangium sp. MJ126-NF4]